MWSPPLYICVVYISRTVCRHELSMSYLHRCHFHLYIYVSPTYTRTMCHHELIMNMWYVTHSRGLIYSSRILIKRLRWVIARRHRYMSSRTLNVTNSRRVIYMSPTRSLSGLLLRSLFQVSFRVCRSLWTCVTRQKAASKGNGAALHDTRSLFMYVGLHSFT